MGGQDEYYDYNGGNDDYYDYNYKDDLSGYNVESVDPSNMLLVIVACYSALCILISLIFKYLKKRQKKSGADNLYDEAGNCIDSLTFKTSKIVVDSITSVDLMVWESEKSASSPGRTKMSKNRTSSRNIYSKHFNTKNIISGESTAESLTPQSSTRSVHSEKFIPGESTAGNLTPENSTRSFNSEKFISGKSTAGNLTPQGSTRLPHSEKFISGKSNTCDAQLKATAEKLRLIADDLKIHSKKFISEKSTDADAESYSSMKKNNAVNVEMQSNDVESNSSYHELIEDDSLSEGDEKHDSTFEYEIKKMVKLALTWSFSSFVETSASLIRIAIISHFMGTGEMICYSYVWFLISLANVISEALYSSLYKHVNNAVALETEEGNINAGKYIRISLYLNVFTSLLVNTALIMTIDPIMRLYGYGEQIALLSQKYMYIAAVNDIMTSTISFPGLIVDIIGHADFDAIFGLVDSIMDILIAMIAVPRFQLDLIQLGVIHIVHDVIMTILYYWITWYRNQWFDKFKEGIVYPLDIQLSFCNLCCCKNVLKGNDLHLVMSLTKKTIPLTFDAITAELEFFFLTFFAAFLGPAESVTWILISYIWEFVGILPACIASAAEYSVANLLSKNNIHLAKQVASMSIWMTVASSAFSCLILFFSRYLIVKAVTKEATLYEMLLEIISYIVICDPILGLSTSVSYLNRALGMYRRSTKIEFLITILVTIPAAAVCTYVFRFNVEGIAAASYFGSATMSLTIVIVYVCADWDKAVEKNKMMSGEYSNVK